jgi:hypothetical protein
MENELPESLREKLKDVAKNAIFAQDACNLSGVVRSFARDTEVLWEVARLLNEGTEFVNRHPVSVLYSNKISALSGSEDFETFSKAYSEAKVLAGE